MTPLRGTWWQEIERALTSAPAPMVSRSSAAPALRGRADQKVAEQHVMAVQSRLHEPVAQVPPPVERVFARPHVAQYCPLERHRREHVEQSREHQAERQQHLSYEGAGVLRHKGGAKQSRTERQRVCQLEGHN
eukprot:scaffold25392_cov72-Phaeocystis_antarctica.AAC.3